jgi:hypothetical protein
VFKHEDEDEKFFRPKKDHIPTDTTTVDSLRSISKWEIVGCGASLSSLFKGICFQPCLYPMNNLHPGRVYTHPCGGVQGVLTPTGFVGDIP